MGSESSETTTSEVRGFDSYQVKLGDQLRGERATQGKSLLDVQRQLRIKAAYIAAIENCDPDVFPNKGFVAGYVRSYARFLNLDPEDVYTRFCAESGYVGVNSSLSPRGVKKTKPGIGMIPSDNSFRPIKGTIAVNQGMFSELSLSAVGSFVVLVSLIAGLAYGGVFVLKDIQRVDITPVDQRPGTLSEMTEIVAPGLGTETVLPDAVSALSVAGDQNFARLYRPRELDVPVMSRRDGPIVDIDPETSGSFSVSQLDTGTAQDIDSVESGMQQLAEMIEPLVREAAGVPNVNVIAQRPAWVRVYQKDGTILFEKILETGETYTLPVDVDAPLLRAGNSGSVFLVLNDQLYGPVGTGTGVAKNVSLLPEDVRANMASVEKVPDVIQASVSALNGNLE